MERIPAAELERVMRVQEVILRATEEEDHLVAGREILGVSVRTMRRWKSDYEQYGICDAQLPPREHLFAFTPCARAITATDAPGFSVSSTISRLSCFVRRLCFFRSARFSSMPEA